MRGRHDSLFFKILFYWDALAVGRYGVVGWDRKSNMGPAEIASFGVFLQIGLAEYRSLREVSPYQLFIGNCLIINHTS